MTVEYERRLRTTDNRMLRRMCGKNLSDKKSSEELRKLTGLDDISDSMRRNRLRWLGHVVRKPDEDWVKRTWSTWEVEGRLGRPKKSWEATISEDCNLLGLRRDDT